MDLKYIFIYNNLIKLSTNKDLYKFFKNNDTFSDRLIFLLIHFAFFLKAYKNKENKVILQNIYDFVFRQLELSIREIGYGDQSINKKMKVYLNLLHSIIDKIHFWEEKDQKSKQSIINGFINPEHKIDYFREYFDNYYDNLKEKTLNYHLKSVINS